MTARIKSFESIEKSKLYPFEEAFEIIQKTKKTGFNQSVDVAFVLGVDSKKSDQTIRGAVALPHGTGKTIHVTVLADTEDAKVAKEAGADDVGYEDLIEKIKKGNIQTDIIITHPSLMKEVGKLGQILGPKGLMPNPKVGTVTKDIASAVKQAKFGQAQYRTEKAGIVHCMIGKIDFDVEKLKENLLTLTKTLVAAKPASAKGVFLKRIWLSTTMGPGLQLDVASLGL